MKLTVSTGWTPIFLACLVCSCASTPDATVSYYLPKSEVSVKVIRTVACNENKEPKIQASVITTTSFVADREGDPNKKDDPVKTVALSQLDGTFANTSTKLSFYPDGRLSGVNASAKGTGKDIVVATLKVAALASGAYMFSDLPGKPKPKPKPGRAFPDECKYISDSTKDDVITLVYEGKLDLRKASAFVGTPPKAAQDTSVDIMKQMKIAKQTFDPETDDLRTLLSTVNLVPNASLQVIKPVIESAADHWMLASMFGDICALVIPGSAAVKAPVAQTGGKVLLWMREPAETEIVVSSGATCVEDEYWRGNILDAERGLEYPIPVPKAAAFGRSSFGVEIAESGRITSLAYEKDTGIGDAASALGDAFDALDGKTDAEKAAELDAQSDLRAAQERWVLCQADRTKCAK